MARFCRAVEEETDAEAAALLRTLKMDDSCEANGDGRNVTKTPPVSLSLSLPNGKNQIDCATLWKQRRTKQTRKTKTIITRMSEMESIPVSPQYQREKKQKRNCRSTNEETGRRNSLFFLWTRRNDIRPIKLTARIKLEATSRCDKTPGLSTPATEKREV